MNIMDLKLNKFQLLIMLTVLLAIPVSLYLANHPQIFKGRATGTPPVEFFQAGGGELETAGGIPLTRDSTVQLKLTYGNSAPTPPPPPPTSGSDLCSFNLTGGQTLGGNTILVLTGIRPDPAYYLSLLIVNSSQGSFQVLSAQANTLFANLSTATLFQNGLLTLECRIQTDPEGGTIISSHSVTVNVQN